MFKKYIILLLTILIGRVSILAQDPYPNLNFSQRTFANWKLYMGPQQGGGGNRTVLYNDISTGAATIPGGYFQFIYPSANPAAKPEDPNTCYNIRRVPLDKKYSVRVGPLSPGGYGNPKGYKAAYTMHVVPERTTLVYSFAFVQQFDHGSGGGNDPAGFGGSASGAGNNASMWLQTLDANGNQVAGVCGNYRLYPGAGKDVSWFDWNYCGEISNTPWITDVLDLKAFIGQDITIEFNTMDCYTGHHMAYAYVSPETFPADTNAYYCPGDSVYISAPRGFKTYQWREIGGTFTDTKHNSGKIGKDLPHVHKLGIANPRDRAKYECTFTSYSGCSAKVVYELIADSIHAAYASDFDTDACRKQVFTDKSSVKYPDYSGVLKRQWNFADPLTGVNNTSTAQRPSHVFSDTGKYQVKLLVTSKTGCKDSLTKPVHIKAQGLPNFTFDNSCQNNSIRFSNTSLALTGTFTKNIWTFGDGNTDIANNPVHKYAAHGTYPVTLKTFTSEGCIDSVTKNVTVYPLPEAKFNLVNKCEGKLVAPADLSTIVSGSITGWEWSYGDGAANTITQQSTHLYKNPGSYKVTLFVNSDKGCKDSVEKTVVIYRNPAAVFTSADDPLICRGIVFTENSTNSEGTITSWKWNFNDHLSGSRNTSNQQHPKHTFSQSGTYEVSLILNSSLGCSDTSKNIITIPPNQAAANFIFNNTCVGSQLSFTDVSTGNISSWKWNFGDNNSASEKSPKHTYTSAGEFAAKLTITFGTCTDSLSRNVTVYPLPEAKFDLKEGCEGSAIIPKEKSVIVSGNIENWQWHFGDGSPAVNAQQCSHIYAGKGNYALSLVVNSDKGCKDSLQKTVHINEMPVADFTLDINKGCAPVCINLTNRSVISTGKIDTYQWLMNSQQLGTTEDLYACFKEAGTQSIVLEVTSSGGCKKSISKTIEVYPLPEAGFSANPQPASTLDPVIHFINLSKGASTYQWIFGDDSYGIFQNEVHTYPRSGLYHVELIAISEYGCESKIAHDIVIDSVYSVHIPNAFSPNGDNVHDLFEIGNIRFFPAAVLEVYNQWGEHVFKSNYGYSIPWDGTKNGQSLPVSTYYYILHLNNEEKKQITGYITLLK